jgi:exosortase/archaeosortase family protein
MLAVIARLTLTFASVFIAFTLLVDPWRRWEARSVTGVLGVLGVAGANRSYGNEILVIPNSSSPFLATISPSCSALAAVLTFVAISVFLLRGEPMRRVTAAAGASALVFVCNLLRISLSVLVGLYTDSHGLVVFHDWVGTAFGLLYVLGGFTLYLWLLLPSNEQLLKEATHAR